MITPEESRSRNALPTRFLYSLGGGIETKCGRGKARLAPLFGAGCLSPFRAP